METRLVKTFGYVINPTQIIEKTLLSLKLSPSDNSIIEVPSNRSCIQFTFKIESKNNKLLTLIDKLS